MILPTYELIFLKLFNNFKIFSRRGF